MDRPKEKKTVNELLQNAGVYDILKPIYFYPNKISGCLSGTNNKALFENIVNTTFDWNEVLCREAFGEGKSDAEINKDIVMFVKKRHELGNWEFPKLDEREENDKMTLEELLKNFN